MGDSHSSGNKWAICYSLLSHSYGQGCTIPLSFPSDGNVAYITALAIENTTMEKQNMCNFGISNILQSNLCLSVFSWLTEIEWELVCLVCVVVPSLASSMNITDPVRSPTDTICGSVRPILESDRTCSSALFCLFVRVLSSWFDAWPWSHASSRWFNDLDMLRAVFSSQKAVTVSVLWQWVALLFLCTGCSYKKLRHCTK